ncbi:uncharacterized protein LOC112564081 isoform X2 [Pomacea canaliculata]|nr:uncharacterized protein LOC112564081 isoform X2 [Pomacea canaliculata]
MQAGLEAALKIGYKTDVEKIRAKNLLAFLLFCQKRETEALQVTEETLQISDQKNIVSLANKAVILWHLGRRNEAQHQVQLLKDLKCDERFDYLLIKAKGELAFSYTRMGPQFIPEAILTFKEILPSAKDPEIWLWKFGLALVYRRALNPRHFYILGQNSLPDDISDLTWQLLQEVIRKSRSTSLQAKAYSELALFLFHNKKDANLQKKTGLTPIAACKKALKLDGKDFSVLVKVGKVFRYERQTKESLDCLQKAESIRSSSSVHHHLALTYKALAKEQFCSQKRLHRKSAAKTVHQCSDIQSRMGREARELRKMIKAPISKAVEFKLTDDFVPQTVEHLKQAMKFSRGENLRAVYDLALMHKVLGETDDALLLLEQIRNSRIAGAFEIVNACEQTGLILKDLSEKEKDENRKMQLEKESESMLMLALQSATANFWQHPDIKPHICTAWNSFSELLTAKDESQNPEHHKLLEKAQLFQLVKNHKEAIAILQRIRDIAPEEGNKPEYLKMLAESYIESEQYCEAVILIEILKGSQGGNSSFGLLESINLTNLYLKAAEQHLLCSQTITVSKFYFMNAFTKEICDEMERMAVDKNPSDSEDKEMWHIMLLYDNEDDDAEKKANTLAELLHNSSGLKVTCMDEDVRLGTFILEGTLGIMKKCHLLVFLVSQNDSSLTLTFYITQAIRINTRIKTFTLTSAKTPELLAPYPSMPYPAELHDINVKNLNCDKSAVTAVCRLFRFLVNSQENTL